MMEANSKSCIMFPPTQLILQYLVKAGFILMERHYSHMFLEKKMLRLIMTESVYSALKVWVNLSQFIF